jgi:hypothetical protein
MSFSSNPTVLIDLAHNEMLNIDDEDFSEFHNLLRHLQFRIKKNENDSLTSEDLKKTDILVLGNPINDYFSNIEIKNVVDFIRLGGRLLIISEYGSDNLQKTNLNDISGKNFGIFFDKNLIKEINHSNEAGTSILHIKNFNEDPITKNLREIVIGGSCSLYIDNNAIPILKTNGSAFSEIYVPHNKKWEKEEREQKQIIAAYTNFGRGKVVAIGDIDIFTNDKNIGLNKLDNRNFITNLMNWFIDPVEKFDVIHWTLDQLGNLQNVMKEINLKINNLIETSTLLEKRISNIEKDLGIQKEE